MRFTVRRAPPERWSRFAPGAAIVQERDEFGTHFVANAWYLTCLVCSYLVAAPPGSASAAARLVATATTSLVESPGPRNRSRTF
jgi:hypothetical protein